MTLTQSNRVRHSTILQTFINNSLCIDQESGQSVDFTSMWGHLGPRYGQRSVDGVVVKLDEPDTYKRLTRKNHAVVKFLFFDANPSERTKQFNEVKITKKCGDSRVGPKVFGMYEFKLLPNDRRSLANKLSGLVGGQSINLFNNSFNRKRFVGCFAMILEDLYDNPVAKVTKGWTLYEFVQAAVRGDDGITKLPVQKLKNKFLQMRKLGIWHGDMHSNNIIVQRIGPVSNQHYEIRIFDYGRSVNLGHNLTTRNEYVELRSLPGAFQYGNRWHVGRSNQYAKLPNTKSYQDALFLFAYAQGKHAFVSGASSSKRHAISLQGLRNATASSSPKRPPPPGSSVARRAAASAARRAALAESIERRRAIARAAAGVSMDTLADLNAFLDQYNKDHKKAWKKVALAIHPNKGGSSNFFQKVSSLYNKYYKNTGATARRASVANAARRQAAANAARRQAAANAARRAASAERRKRRTELEEMMRRNAAANAARKEAGRVFNEQIRKKLNAVRRNELERIVRFRRGNKFAVMPLGRQTILVPMFPTASELKVAASLNRREAAAANNAARKAAARSAERRAEAAEYHKQQADYKKLRSITNFLNSKYSKYSPYNKNAQRGWGSWAKEKVGLRKPLYQNRLEQLGRLGNSNPAAQALIKNIFTPWLHTANYGVAIQKMSKSEFEEFKANLTKYL